MACLSNCLQINIWRGKKEGEMRIVARNHREAGYMQEVVLGTGESSGDVSEGALAVPCQEGVGQWRAGELCAITRGLREELLRARGWKIGIILALKAKHLELKTSLKPSFLDRDQERNILAEEFVRTEVSGALRCCHSSLQGREGPDDLLEFPPARFSMILQKDGVTTLVTRCNASGGSSVPAVLLQVSSITLLHLKVSRGRCPSCQHFCRCKSPGTRDINNCARSVGEADKPRKIN